MRYPGSSHQNDLSRARGGVGETQPSQRLWATLGSGYSLLRAQPELDSELILDKIFWYPLYATQVSLTRAYSSGASQPWQDYRKLCHI